MLILNSLPIIMVILIITGFVLLLEVLEKPWNLILDFKGTCISSFKRRIGG